MPRHEMSQLADHLVVIGRGRLIADTTVDAFVERSAGRRVRVRSPEAERLAGLLAERGTDVDMDGPEAFIATGIPATEIGEIAARHRVVLHELVTQQASLEQAFIAVTGDAADSHTTSPDTPATRDSTQEVASP